MGVRNGQPPEKLLHHRRAQVRVFSHDPVHVGDEKEGLAQTGEFGNLFSARIGGSHEVYDWTRARGGGVGYVAMGSTESRMFCARHGVDRNYSWPEFV